MKNKGGRKKYSTFLLQDRSKQSNKTKEKLNTYYYNPHVKWLFTFKKHT